MGNYFVYTLWLSTLLATVMSAPQPLPQGPFAAIGNLIQRLQTSFYEGSNSIRQPLGNSFTLPLLTKNLTTTSTTSTTTTTTTTTTPRPRPPNPFDSINAIHDNISRPNNNNNVISNSILNNPPRNPFVFAFTTAAPTTTTRNPFNLDGINQGINAFFQAFIKTNIQKIFNPGQNSLQGGQQQQHQITTRSDASQLQLQQQRPPSLGEIIINSLFRKQNQ